MLFGCCYFCYGMLHAKFQNPRIILYNRGRVCGLVGWSCKVIIMSNLSRMRLCWVVVRLGFWQLGCVGMLWICILIKWFLDWAILTQKSRHFYYPEMGLENGICDLLGAPSIGYRALQTTFGKEVFWFKQSFCEKHWTLTSHG